MSKIVLKSLLMFFGLVSLNTAFANTDTKNSPAVQDLRKKFEETKSRALGTNFSSPEARKAYLTELAALEKIFESASEILQKKEAADFKVTPETKALTSMAIELSFLEELEQPVKSKFARQPCLDSLAATQASLEAHAELSQKILDILKKNCPVQK